MWDVNNGAFKIRGMAVVTDLRFLQFTSKRNVNNSHFYINHNKSQKCNIIFGLDFLIEKKIGFILSIEMIDWKGIQVSMHNNTPPNDEKEWYNNGNSCKTMHIKITQGVV